MEKQQEVNQDTFPGAYLNALLALHETILFSKHADMWNKDSATCQHQEKLLELAKQALATFDTIARRPGRMIELFPFLKGYMVENDE